MSGQNNYGVSWEERQAQLIRSLFTGYPPELSPVMEEEEPSDSLSINERPPSAQVGEYPERPHHSPPSSPLPPLIIEKERNKHDEPEEFYVKLAVRMRRAYRRLFVENRSDVGDLSDDSSTYLNSQGSKRFERRASFGDDNNEHDDLQTYEIGDVENTGINDFEMVNENEDQERQAMLTDDKKGSSSTDILPKITTDHSQGDDTNGEISSINTASPKSSTNGYESFVKEIVHKSTNSEEKSIEVRRRSSKEIPSSDGVEMVEEEEEGEEEKDSKSESEHSETSTGLDVGYRQITFKADVHIDAPEQIAQKTPSLVYEQNMTGEETLSSHSDEIDKQADMEENNVSNANISSEGNEDYGSKIEVMRNVRINTSADSLKNKPYRGSHSNGNARKRSTSLGALRKSTNIMEYEESIGSEILHTSKISGECRNENNLSTKKRKSSTSLRYSSPKKTKSVGTQINVDDWNRRILSGNIFVGIPRVFRLV